MEEHSSSKVVKSIKIEVISGEKNEVNLFTQFSDKETIRILKECLISLEREASQKK